MFDRDTAVQRWRTALLSRSGASLDDIEELQVHLSDIEAELEGLRLSPEERFWIAAHRVGGPDELAREFRRVSPERGWALPVVWGLLLPIVWFLLAMVAAVATELLVAASALALPRYVPQTLQYLVIPISVALVPLVAILVVRRWRTTPDDVLALLDRGARAPFRAVVAAGALVASAHLLARAVSWLRGAAYDASTVEVTNAMVRQTVAAGQVAFQITEGFLIALPFLMAVMALVIFARYRRGAERAQGP